MIVGQNGSRVSAQRADGWQLASQRHEVAEGRSACPRRIDSGYEAAGLASGLWKREYVRCIFVSSAARPTAGAAAIRARSLFRFFFRC